MSERKIKFCDECKTGFPVKSLVQYEGYYLLVCVDCSKKLNNTPNERTYYPDIESEGFYEPKFPETDLL
jgi:flavoprotein